VNRIAAHFFSHRCAYRAIANAILICCFGTGTISAVTPTSVDWTRTAYIDRYNYAYGLAPDHQGNLYFAGNETPPSNPTSWAFFLTKINSAGQTQWQQEIGSPTGAFNAPAYSNCLELGLNATALLSGRTTESIGVANPDHIEQAIVMNYNAQGSRLWAWQMGSVNHSYAGNSTADAQGNVFVTGQSGEFTGAFLVKLNSTGGLVWRRDFGLSLNDESFRAALDGQGNIYVAGGTFGNLAAPNAGSRDVFLSKFDSAGTLQWTRQFGTPDNDVAYGGVEIDPQGNLYISGGIYPASGPGMAFLRKFDTSGNQIWAQQFNGDVRDMTIDANGTVYLARNTDIAGYDSTGSLIWTAPSSMMNQTGLSSVLAFDPVDGHLYVGGVKTGVGGYNAAASRLAPVVPEPSAVILAAFGLVPLLFIAPRRSFARRVVNAGYDCVCRPSGP
jgi:hypothetical protein